MKSLEIQPHNSLVTVGYGPIGNSSCCFPFKFSKECIHSSKIHYGVSRTDVNADCFRGESGSSKVKGEGDQKQPVLTIKSQAWWYIPITSVLWW